MSTNAKLIHGDCLVELPKLEAGSVDMIFADPPFNVGKRYAGKDTDSRADYYEWCESWIAECFRVLKETGTMYHMTIDRHLEKMFPIMGKYGNFVNLIKWRNVSAQHSKRQFWNSTQPILMYSKSKKYKFNTYAQERRRKDMIVSWSKERAGRTKGQLLDYWDDIKPVFAGSIKHKEAILKDGTNKKLHLAQMPLGLSDRCIMFSTDEGDTVLEPFAGIGASFISSLRLGRKYIGYEKERMYVDAINERVRLHKKQPVLIAHAEKEAKKAPPALF